MAANNRRLSFIDPYHLLMKKDYEGGQCDICLLELAGFDGYGCDSCNIHIHRTCADCFGETTSFSANQSSLTFKLSRSPPHDKLHICGGCCPPGTFVYHCTRYGYNMHPLCSKLPERARSPSPFYQGHDLFLVYSPGYSCSACRYPLPMWHYSCCGCCSLKLHISCASFGPPTATGVVGQRYNPRPPLLPPSLEAVTQWGYGPPPIQVNYDGSGQSIVIATAKLLFHIMFGDLASPLGELLSAVLNRRNE
ncbi:LOW QUALITY PROTEIN: hypothetical protein SETIT_2G386100v2 [Setaria italica]|uniref:Phorbol-ester/DAG-type domain-containing protein n=1 Tax=Setaria italica TaxID=4555 RepID=A0A368Q7U5_SETIT|nr:LOW QUALITY PROTEIN: hypothetical protein SETIT_2G386100v2 [Setaria italica]